MRGRGDGGRGSPSSAWEGLTPSTAPAASHQRPALSHGEAFYEKVSKQIVDADR